MFHHQALLDFPMHGSDIVPMQNEGADKGAFRPG